MSGPIVFKVDVDQLDQRLKKVGSVLTVDLNKTSTDVLIVNPEKTSTTIAQVRGMKKFFASSPNSADYKVGVVTKAESLTVPAQQALLKLLEEPPEFAKIALVVKNSQKLLPTILSRCRLVSDVSGSQEVLEQTEQLYQSLVGLGVGERLLMAENYNKKREQGLELVGELVKVFRKNMKLDPIEKWLFNLKLSLYVNYLLESNVNSKLAVDFLFLRIK